MSRCPVVNNKLLIINMGYVILPFPDSAVATSFFLGSGGLWCPIFRIQGKKNHVQDQRPSI